jgi:hypothetical protein
MTQVEPTVEEMIAWCDAELASLKVWRGVTPTAENSYTIVAAIRARLTSLHSASPREAGADGGHSE